jgi:uncharacterized protein (TIGR03435 family)
LSSLLDGPEWVAKEKYDLDGKPDGEGQPSEEQWKSMIGKLLVVAKNGPKIAPSARDPNGSPGLLFRGLAPATLPVRNATMAEFASVMQRAVLDRPVLDQTKIEGRYDFMLRWTPDESQFTSLGGVHPQPDLPDAPPDLFTAIQQEAGLKLDSTKAMVDVLVIDKVEKPSEN